MSFGLTGSGSTETARATTDEPDEDLYLHGGTTNLTSALVQIGALTGGEVNLGISGPYRSGDKLPVLAAFGKRDSARPYIFNEAPYPFTRRNRLRAIVTNAGTETGGHIVLLGTPTTQPDAADMPVVGNMFFLKADANFTGAASQTTNDSTKAQAFDVLVVGAYCDMVQPGTSIRITDAEGKVWMPPDTYTPAWAIAGRPGGQLPVMRWPVRYRLREGGSLRVAFKNDATAPESNRSVWFACYQLRQEAR
jgi:hypothetical protein